MAIYKTEAELLEQLKQQIGLLCRSASLYDKGHEDEALKLATSIRVLVYDGSKSTSLLTHLKRKTMKFYDSALTYTSHSSPSYFGLLRIRMSTRNGVSYFPPLDDIDHPRSKTKKINFDNWWRGVVIKDKYGKEFTRKDLVLEVANTDGGAHVDNKLKDGYAGLSRSNVSGFRVFRGGIGSDFSNRSVFPSIRQITLELLKTLRDEFPGLFSGIRIRRK